MCALGDGDLGLSSRGIDHADQAEQDEIVFDALRQLDRRRTVGAAGARVEA
jgi:hypothetical protein